MRKRYGLRHAVPGGKLEITKEYEKGVEDIFDQDGRQEALSQGAKFDMGKVMLELLPPDALWVIGEVLTHGAHKYAPYNWAKGIEYGRVYGALLRHLFAWWGGENNDPETGLSHLAHAGCCLLFLLSYELRGMEDFDDRWRLNGTEDNND